jgi:hypoxanthine phosphoribosyltransferase
MYKPGKRRLENLKLSHLSWDDVQRLSEKVSEKIASNDLRPDLVVAISRGGFDPARIICDQLLIKRLASIQIEYYTGINETNAKPKIVFPLNADIKNLKVLVVDDVSDSGKSLLFAKEYLESLGPKNVKTSTLHYKPWSKYRPDYFAEEVDSWIIYPWEMREGLIEMAMKLESEGIPRYAIPNQLAELGFQKESIKRYLPASEDV